MSLCPFATHRLMPYNDRLPRREQSPTLILHTNGGGTDHGSLYGWFSRAGNDICSHFQVASDGTIEQYLDTDRVGYAQFSGNAYAVSVETEDDRDPSKPWTPQQVASIVRLADWLNVPARVSPNGPGGGIGWHSLYADWNQSGHNCPGPVRIDQIRRHVIPALGHHTGPTPSPHDNHAPGWYRRLLSLSSPMLHGVDVQHVQRAVGVPDDGWYGRQTKAAVVRYQQHHHLAADGVVGPATATAIGG